MEKVKNQFRYQKIYEDIRKGIENGSLEAGSKLPIDEELKNEYGVSVITVKKALLMLKEEGLIQRVPGVGSFVTGKPADIRSKEPPKKEEASDTERQETAALRPEASRKKLGLILEHVSTAYGLDMLYQIDREAERHGFKLYPRFSYYSTQKETEEIEFLLSEGIEGLIIMPCHGLYYNPSLLKQIINGFPVVIVDKKMDGIPVPCVRTDNAGAISALIHHLHEKGCRNFGYLSNKITGTSSLLERREGFYAAMEELGIREYSECVIENERFVFQKEPSAENISRVCCYLEEHPSLDAVVCAEYGIITLLKAAAKELSLDLQRMKIVCVDGPDNSNYLHMHQDEINMANRAVELILDRIQRKQAGGYQCCPSQEEEILIPAILVDKKKD